ncbi:TPA: hypothetical protein DF272_05160 [Candidatus Falkowbacteria bacterium]|nr:hypothetical protein [Candidatus Falkowbacteria bacterium]
MPNLNRSDRFIYWTPRILSALFILFLALFSLDIFDLNLDFWGTLLGLFMHNLPSIFLLIILFISWRYELVGAIAYCLGGIIYIILLLQNPFEWYMLGWAVQISGVAFFISVLFFLGWRHKQKNKII